MLKDSVLMLMPWTNYLSLDNFLFWFRTSSYSCQKSTLQNSQKLKKNNYSTWRTIISAYIHYSLLSECLIYGEESFPRHSAVASIHNTIKRINRIKCHSVFTNLPFHFLLSSQSDIQAKTMVLKPHAPPAPSSGPRQCPAEPYGSMKQKEKSVIWILSLLQTLISLC